MRYNGQMVDSNFTLTGPPRVKLPAFTLVNIGADYRLTEKLSVYGRVENAADEEYEEIYTYASPGRAAYIGLKAASEPSKCAIPAFQGWNGADWPVG